jgi:hypothetical protein
MHIQMHICEGRPIEQLFQVLQTDIQADMEFTHRHWISLIRVRIIKHDFQALRLEDAQFVS